MNQSKFQVESAREATLDELVRRIGCIVAYYRGGGGSIYEKTKEVWGALETLLNLRESQWNQWISMISKRYIMREVGQKDGELFEKLLFFLLQRFAEEAKGYSPSMKREMAKMIRDALDSTVRNPYPDICFYVKDFHSERLSDERFKNCKEVLRE
ncbi:MAG: hypothetical protein ACPLSA_04865 [Caldanaerobacter sp.]